MSVTSGRRLTFEGSAFTPSSCSSLWLLAAGTDGVGDIVTTIAIVWYTPLYAEANPIVQFAVETFGIGGLVGLKLVAFGVTLGVSLWGLTDDDLLLFYGPPVGLALLGAFLTTSNLTLLLV
jgi:hypothetical protein